MLAQYWVNPLVLLVYNRCLSLTLNILIDRRQIASDRDRVSGLSQSNAAESRLHAAVSRLSPVLCRLLRASTGVPQGRTGASLALHRATPYGGDCVLPARI